ncbi:MAG: DUF4381 domain-containing protein [Neisseriaceae bacterium]|nr:MAG: DUF4381 domain-containing protein [Neisseriaceae bacterium]
MENNSLADLKDIHLPAPVSIFPLAPGWYIVLAVLLVIIILFILWQMRRASKQYKLKQVLALLAQIEAKAESSDAEQREEVLPEISILLKRVAREKFSELHPQNLFGEKWLQFLDRSGKTTEFTSGAGRILLDVYKRQSLESPQELLGVVKNWLRTVIL